VSPGTLLGTELQTGAATRSHVKFVAASVMAPKGGKSKGGKRMDDSEMVKLLTGRIATETPAAGTNPLADQMSADAPPLAKRFDQVCKSDCRLLCHPL